VEKREFATLDCEMGARIDGSPWTGDRGASTRKEYDSYVFALRLCFVSWSFVIARPSASFLRPSFPPTTDTVGMPPTQRPRKDVPNTWDLSELIAECAFVSCLNSSKPDAMTCETERDHACAVENVAVSGHDFQSFPRPVGRESAQTSAVMRDESERID
jgi:hypothetical protein